LLALDNSIVGLHFRKVVVVSSVAGQVQDSLGFSGWPNWTPSKKHLR